MISFELQKRAYYRGFEETLQKCAGTEDDIRAYFQKKMVNPLSQAWESGAWKNPALLGMGVGGVLGGATAALDEGVTSGSVLRGAAGGALTGGVAGGLFGGIAPYLEAQRENALHRYHQRRFLDVLKQDPDAIFYPDRGEIHGTAPR